MYEINATSTEDFLAKYKASMQQAAQVIMNAVAQDVLAASINQPGLQGPFAGSDGSYQPNDPFEGDPAAKTLHDRLAAEEADTTVCPLCRDIVPRSKPQCTSIVFCNSMPIRKEPL